MNFIIRMCRKCARSYAPNDTDPCVCEGGPERKLPSLDEFMAEFWRKRHERIYAILEESTGSVSKEQLLQTSNKGV